MATQTTPQRPIRAGVFNTLSSADRAVDELLRAGFTRDTITVVCTEEAVKRHFRAFQHQDPAGTHTPEAAMTGGAIGAVLGSLTTVAAIAATGGIGLLAAGGLGLGAGGIAGSFIGAMMTRGIEQEAANFYDQEVQRGQILVAAEANEDNDASLATAERILSRAGAEPVPLSKG